MSDPLVPACSCKPGCTDSHVADHPELCDADCAVCRLMRGVAHDEVVEWRRNRQKGVATDVDDARQLPLQTTIGEDDARL